MKKALSFLLAVVMLCSLCGVSALAVDLEELAGSYELTGLVDSSGMDYTSYIPLLVSAGVISSLEIREDGKAMLNGVGQTMSLEINVDDMTIKLYSQWTPFTYEDGDLSFLDEEEGMTFTFSKVGLPASAQPFDYYVLEEFRNGDGKSTSTADQDAVVALYLFADDTAEMVMPDSSSSFMLFNMKEKTVLFGTEEVPFTLEDGVLTLANASGYMVFRQADPGYAGPYRQVAFTARDTSDPKAAGEGMDPAADLYRLTIGEDGAGVMEAGDRVTELQFDFEKMIVTYEDEEDGESREVPFTYENGRLCIGSGESELVFGRILATEKAASDADTKAAK